ncbi:MAG: phosphoribosylformylglycinamidine synthase subunit PurL [Candidatus Latescibacterota bacterium]
MNSIQEEYLIALDQVGDEVRKRFLREHNLSLKDDEIANLHRLLGRHPSLVELHIFNTMWSEHCSYKSSREVLKKYLPTKAKHVVLGPGEDAGIVRFFEKDGRSYCLVLAHESHNHPSQILPVEGAATGIGGIVRDVYCMGADVLGVMDPLRFGDPDGRKGARVRDIVRGVVDGIAQYANALGVPNLGGDAVFDASFDDNCLVNVVAIGLVEEQDIIRSRAPEGSTDTAHDVILIGKPTDASGFGGATFASERLSEDDAVEQQGAVQVPDPFLKRVLAEATKSVFALAKSKEVRIGFKDLGAGGICCAVSEMAAAGGVGIHIDLKKVNRAFAEMPAEVIACSETQERYAMVVPGEFTRDVLRIYNENFELPHLYRGAGAFHIGHVTDDKRFKVSLDGQLVCDADVDAITTGILCDRVASKEAMKTPRPLPKATQPGIKEALLALLTTYNISDKSKIFTHYDTEVQGRAVLRPGEADAAVSILLPGEAVGLAAACGGSSRIAARNPYLGGMWAVIEAARNVACVGAEALAVTDCLNYGDPEDQGVFWQFTEGVRGIGDACRSLGSQEAGEPLPVISGNVSFYNQSETGEPIAPSPIVACAGRVDDVAVCRSMGFKKKDSVIALLGRMHASMGGSEYAAQFGCPHDSPPPEPELLEESALQRLLVDGIRRGAIVSAHDISHGGTLVTVCEMMLCSTPSVVGCALSFDGEFDADTPLAHYLFSEYGGVVVEVVGHAWNEFANRLQQAGVGVSKIGRTCGDAKMQIRVKDKTIELSFDEIAAAYSGKCHQLFG